jgi:hypothetical protein
MRELFARGVVVLTATVISIVMFGSGVAAADYAGQKYGDVTKAFDDNKLTAVIATIVGDQLPLDECIVTRWRLDNNDKSRGLLYLNCNDAVATAGSAGNSAASPQGKAAKLDQKRAARINKDPHSCDATPDIVEWCTLLCKRTELCTYGT